MVVGTDRASSVYDRIEGYRLALDQAELGQSAVNLIEWHDHSGSTSAASAECLLRDAMSRSDAPTALFAVNDRIALHLFEAAKNLGIPVPGELSIVGFDWLLREIPASKQISTVAQPFEEIGQVAAQRLLDLVHQNVQEVPRQILLNATLIVGASSGSPGVSSLAYR
jgi:LacI family transcriptional regulator